MSAPTPVEKKPETVQLERIDDCLLGKQAREARVLAEEFVDKNPENVDGWILLGRAHLDLLQFSSALEAGKKAIALMPQHPVARLLLIDALLRCGHSEEAFQQAKALEDEKKFDPVILQKLGYFYSQINRFSDAVRCYERACVLQPANSALHTGLAGAYIAMGALDKAETIYNDMTRRRPHEIDTYYNRAAMRKQTPERNHVAELEKVLAQHTGDANAEPLLCYSLAKELEDLGEWKRSFSYLQRGANMRKRTVPYQVETDLEFLDAIREQFDETFFAQNRQGYEDESPFFVLGLPRSGTTLVDRILSSHSTVGSIGESIEFSATLIRQADTQNKSGQVAIEALRRLDFAALGREYCRNINGMLPGKTHVLDKTPNNFNYVGLILAALPNAKIVHLRRHPVDSCYALYKMLFRDGYLYSYDLNDLARYYLGYDRLMAHWRKLFPGRFFDLQYEALVESQEDVTREMINFCGLEWEDACLSFEKNPSPSLTASAIQVRQPIYKSSVALWRRYEEELAPLIRGLREGGINVD